MWTYYRVANEGYVRLDLDTHAAEEFLMPEAEWSALDAWYDEIQYNGQGAKVPENEAMAAVLALTHRASVA
jgi:hypothetical protein